MQLGWYTAFYEQMSGKLGPDPLREDADGEKLWEKMQTSRKPVGLMLMDQSAIAGIGNIYRAEILFKVSWMCCQLHLWGLPKLFALLKLIRQVSLFDWLTCST